MPLAYHPTPIGTLRISGDERGISEVQFTQTLAVSESVHPSLRECIRQLEEFFAGTRRDFSIPLAARGTPFQEAVWEALRRIPYGETRTYADIAAAIENSGALRAVGTACGANPLCIITPCHRVLAKDGIGGYSGGLEKKRWLLTRENARSAP